MVHVQGREKTNFLSFTGEKNFWQRNYYEHVIKTEMALSKIRGYIQNNPLVETVKFKQFYGVGLKNSKGSRVR